MNQFKPHQDRYDNKFVMPQLHKAVTSPLPIVPKQQVNYYPPSWDKPAKMKMPKVPPISSILSNHHYVIACVIFTSIIVLISMIKVVLLIIAK